MKKDWRNNNALVFAIAITAWLLISLFIIKCFPMSEEQFQLHIESKGFANSNTTVMTCGATASIIYD